MGKEGFNKIIRGGAGQLADKAKQEEYERLMRHGVANEGQERVNSGGNGCTGPDPRRL